MIAFTAPDRVESLMARLREAGESPVPIGEVVAADTGERVRTTGRLALT